MVQEYKASWAEECELNDGVMPLPTETIMDGKKTVTEYRKNKDGKTEVVVRTYEIIRHAVSKAVARRKLLPKFGESKNDKPGLNPHTTLESEETAMQEITKKEEKTPKDLVLNPSKGLKCRYCTGGHFTTECPHQHTEMYRKAIIEEQQTSLAAPPSQPGKYVAPGFRGVGDNQKYAAGFDRDDSIAIRISNLSESCTETDLEDLVRPFGKISKMFLAKHKNSDDCKGFAYVHFFTKAEANIAIATLNGFGYDHLILKAEWSKPAIN